MHRLATNGSPYSHAYLLILNLSTSYRPVVSFISQLLYPKENHFYPSRNRRLRGPQS